MTPVVVTSPKYEFSEFCPEYALISGIKYYRTNEKEKGSSFVLARELSQLQNFKRRIREIVTEENVDVIHVHSPSLNAMAAMGAKRSGKKIPIIYHIRALWEDAAVEGG